MSFAYMPLYTGDYLRDTRHLTPLRHGIYLLALMHCWDSKGPMPLDEQECAGICNCRSADEVEALRYILGRYFVRTEDGHYNVRMTEVVRTSEAVSGKRQQAGRAGGLARAAAAERGAKAALEQARRPPLPSFADTGKPAYIEAPPAPPSDTPGKPVKQMPSKCQANAKHELVSPTPTPTPMSLETESPSGLQSLVASAEPKPPAAVAGEDDPGAGKATALPPCPTQAIVDLYHEALPMLPRCEVMNEARRRSIAARWREVAHDHRAEPDPRTAAIEWFRWFFTDRVAASRFLTGRVKDWRASLDWLMGPVNFAKAAEGRYLNDRETTR